MIVGLGTHAPGAAPDVAGATAAFAQRRVPLVHAENLTGHSVLVVEDEGLIALELSELFKDAGARVLTAADVEEGIKLAEGAEIGLAIVDYRMGTEDAAEICRRLLKRHVPFFFFTGDPGVAEQWPDVPVLQKPASEGEILATATALVETDPAP